MSYGSRKVFVESFAQELSLYFSGAGGSSRNVCLIGRVLKGNVDSEKKEILGKNFDLDSIQSANRAVAFYEHQIKSARFAVDTWTLVGMRCGIVKELIAMLIWEARVDSNYSHCTF